MFDAQDSDCVRHLVGRTNAECDRRTAWSPTVRRGRFRRGTRSASRAERQRSAGSRSARKAGFDGSVPATISAFSPTLRSHSRRSDWRCIRRFGRVGGGARPGSHRDDEEWEQDDGRGRPRDSDGHKSSWATAEEKRNPVPSTFQGFSRSWVSLSEIQNGKKCRGRSPATGVRVGETRRALPTPFDRVSTAVVHVRRRRRGREAGRCCEWLSVRRSVTRRARAAVVRR